MTPAEMKRMIQGLKADLEEMRPKQPLPMLIIRFSSEVNVNAPPGTRADEDLEDDGTPDCFAMRPPGNNEQPPPGVPTYEEWLAMGNEKIKGGKRAN
jgi:hypothetical protein